MTNDFKTYIGFKTGNKNEYFTYYCVQKKENNIVWYRYGDNYNLVQENELFVYETFLLFFEINEENKVKYEYYE